MSEPDVIDPSLDDPSMAFLQNLSESHSSLSAQPSLDMDNPGDDEELPLNILSHSQSPSGNSAPRMPQTEAPGSCPSFDFPEIGRMVKKRKRLTFESEAELDRFCVPVCFHSWQFRVITWN
jgi:hypothetical protein